MTNEVIEFKKHYLQMSSGEHNLIRKKLLNLDTSHLYKSLNINPHLQRRQERKRITFTLDCITRWLRYGKIIEYKIHQRLHSYSERVVIRGTYDKVDDVVLVIDVTNSVVVTAWKNSVTDNHSTLRLKEYCTLLKVI